jgi:alpha,alpha-trehalase
MYDGQLEASSHNWVEGQGSGPCIDKKAGQEDDNYDAMGNMLDEACLTENLVDRLLRMIKNLFWHALMRCIDGVGLEIITADPKNRTGCIDPQIYVPHSKPTIAVYYRKVSMKLDDPLFVKSLNSKPGVLAWAMDEVKDGKGGQTMRGISFIVPGARFNEVCPVSL